jgi:2-polyprenyl-3-methyl-5-hydroxy-6-metoxy-1,4-benzoquinol methylase
MEKWELKDKLIRVLYKVDEFDLKKMMEVERICSIVLDGMNTVSNSSNEVFEKINSLAWTPAVDPDFMLDLNSEDDKFSRARGILSQFVLEQLGDVKILDFGCGEGHVTNMFRSVNQDISLVVGYDIEEQWAKVPLEKPDFFTSDIEKMKEFGPYDIILMHDVIDHCRQPLDTLQLVKQLLHPAGEVKIRVHPWSSRSGAHHYRAFNKGWAHMLLSEEQLVKAGVSNLPFVYKNLNPDVYREWFNECGFRVADAQEHWEPAGPEPFENQPIMKAQMLKNYPGFENINYSMIERTFIDYSLRV